MADEENRVDLIQRYAEKLAQKDHRSLAERAAERLAQMNQAPAEAPPTPPTAKDTPPANALHKAAVATPIPPPPPPPPLPPEGESILTATGRRQPSPAVVRPHQPASPAPTPPERSIPVPVEEPSILRADAALPSGGGVLSAAGRRIATTEAEAPSVVEPIRQKARRPRKKGDAEGIPTGASSDAGKVAHIDLVRLQVAGYVTPQSERTRISEEYRVIKRPLLLNAFARGEHRIPNGHLIMVTSARPGEGKTFTSLNLAMSMASERELFVLLIDADVHRGTLMRELGVKAQKGLVDLLVDDSLTLHDTLLRTNVPNLTLLPSGMQHSEATELLASQRMAKLMSDIATRYPDRVIIIDTPPVLASSEAGVLGLLVGQVVMVVEWGATTRQAVEQALPLIGTCQNINFVLNKATFYVGSDRFGMYTADGVYGA